MALSFCCWNLWTKLSHTDAHRMKLHLVASQRASFISKNVVDHTQVLDDAHVSNLRLLTIHLIEEAPVTIY